MELRIEIDEYGTKCYYNDRNKLHREDGPAIEWFDGLKEWWINGKQHREDGPAYEDSDGYKEWWINGKELSEKEFDKIVQTNQKISELQQSIAMLEDKNRKLIEVLKTAHDHVLFNDQTHTRTFKLITQILDEYENG